MIDVLIVIGLIVFIIFFLFAGISLFFVAIDGTEFGRELDERLARRLRKKDIGVIERGVTVLGVTGTMEDDNWYDKAEREGER